MRAKIASIIKERYGGVLPRGALKVIAEEVGVSRQYVWTVAVDFAQAGREADALRRRCAIEGCHGYARGRSIWCVEHIYLQLVCQNCGARFRRARIEQKRKERNPNFSGLTFCGRRCFGQYIGARYGFKKKSKDE